MSSAREWACLGRNADGSACPKSFPTKVGRNIHRTLQGHHPREDKVAAGDSIQEPRHPRLRLQPKRR